VIHFSNPFQRDDKLEAQTGACYACLRYLQQLSKQLQLSIVVLHADMPILSWLDPEFVQFLFEANQFTISQTVEFLEASYPNQKGLSVRNMKRFMHDNGIKSQKPLTNDDLRKEMQITTAEVDGVVGV
jgi:hypothetical protein